MNAKTDSNLRKTGKAFIELKGKLAEANQNQRKAGKTQIRLS